MSAPVQSKGRRTMSRNLGFSILLAAAVGLGACGGQPPGELVPGGAADPAPATGTGSSVGSASGAGGGGGGAAAHTALDDRTQSYGEALRTASLKLVRALPTLAQQKTVAEAKDPKAAYEAALDDMLGDVRFQERMIKWWQDVMRQGETGQPKGASRDTAPTFAARVVVDDKPFTELFTASSNTCPTYDDTAHQFSDGDCNGGAPVTAGVLTDPGVMKQFFGDMAFRRVRWVQEIFVCTKFPAEYAKTPIKKGTADYVSPWPFDSVAPAPIDFQDTSSVVCANCHTTINHIAPLFANFDAEGMWQSSIQVETPLVKPVKTQMSDWLKDGEKLSWRFGKTVSDLASLGQAMAADPDVAACAVTRAWNFTMSKEDVVSDLATVPAEVLAVYQKAFNANGMSFKKTLRAMFASDDFTKF